VRAFASVIAWAFVASSQANAQSELRVPRRSAPRIDGRIGADEWAGSVEAALPDGGRVLMRHDGAYLYVAIRSGKHGFASTCVARGDTVRILHASAALADAMYVSADRSEPSPCEPATRARQITLPFASISASTAGSQATSR
jgi:hypothetical protein